MSDTFISNSFQVPNAYVDDFMGYLTPEEFACLIYASRRIFGFQKRQDRIALSQFENGITLNDGRILDHGTGLSHYAVKKAIKGLITAGLLIKLESAKADRTPALYALQLEPSAVNMAWLEKRLGKKNALNRAKTENARASALQGKTSDPVLEQGNVTDPVQGNATEDNRVTQQTPQKQGKTRENNNTSLLLSSSYSEKEQELISKIESMELTGHLSVEEVKHWIGRLYSDGETKTLAYLRWCKRNGVSYAKAYNTDKKYDKVPNWSVQESQNEQGTYTQRYKDADGVWREVEVLVEPRTYTVYYTDKNGELKTREEEAEPGAPRYAEVYV